MSQKTNYYKIGLFATIAFTLLIGFLIFMGASNWFAKEQYAETYFDESVQGLSVGSPVKYRGVTIGEVKRIDVINNIYGDGGLRNNNNDLRYIYVEFSLSPRSNSGKKTNNPLEILQNNIKNGLRVSLATADLVGNVYLAINFQDPEKNPPLPVTWTPNNLYIPSAKSTLSRFTDSLDTVFSELTTIDYKNIITHIDTLAVTATKTLEDLDTKQLSEQLQSTLKQVDALTTTINNALNSDESNALLHSLMTDSNLLEQTLSQAAGAMQQLNALSTRVNTLTASQQRNITDTINNLKQMSLHLEIASDTIKNNPQSLLFGQTTPATEPGQ